MPAEKFANRPEAEVAATYTATDTTLEVDDASAFPATGPFRVLLGNTEGTIFRVDSVAGNVFTGAAEAFDGNAAIGVSVRIVASKEVAERFLQAPDAGGIHAPSGALGAVLYGPTWRTGRPDLLSWAWVNQGGATITDANGISYLVAPSAATSIRARVLAAPATPYTITALLRTRGVIGNNTQYGGLVFRESGTGKLYIWYVANNGALQAIKFTNPTTFSAIGAVNTSIAGVFGGFVWHRVTDDGTNLRFALSLDGVNFLEYGTEGRTVFMAGAPNEVGLFANVDSAAGVMAVSLMSWLQT